MPMEVTLTFFHRKSVPRSFKQFVVPSVDINFTLTYLNFTFFVALSVVLFNLILQSKIFPSTFEKSRV